MIKKIIFLFFVVLAIIYFRGINNHTKTNNSNSKIRIVSLSPSVTKKIIELDKTEYLVGRTFFCNYNEVKNVDVVSDLTHFNIDKIILLHPTHVISEYPIDEKSLYILKKNNIYVISLNTPKSINDIIANTEIIARITNSENRLKQLIKEFNGLKPLKQFTNHSIYFVLASGTSEFTAGKNTYINDFINLIGAKNIASNVNNWSYSKEYLLNSNPEFFMGSTFSIDQISKISQYKNITAIKSKNYIYILPEVLNVPTIGNIISSYKYISNQKIN